MKNRTNHMALPWLLVLAVGMTAAVAAHAQYGVPAPPAVDFRYPPRWVTVPGTSVMMIRRDERPDYDMFNFGARYYIYENGYWYRANTWNGPFNSIDERSLPRAIRDVPQDEWRTYPTAWTTSDNGRYGDRDQDNGRYNDSGAPAPPRVYFRTTPAWILVPGTSVRMIRRDQRPGYDMFDYGSEYYIYSNGYWYEADSPNGPFNSIDEGDVPLAIQRVPESEWRDYPSRWAGNGNGRGTTSYRPSRESWRYDVSRAPAPPEIYFRRNPRWAVVPGTRVMVVRGYNRPRYDLFRVDGRYYLEVSGYWYRSNRLNGPFVAMDARRVPTELASVPRSYWRSYPEDWAMGVRGRYRPAYQR